MEPAFLYKKGLYIKALRKQKLDEQGQHLLYNILLLYFKKIDQQLLSKLFVTSLQTLTCSKPTRETLKLDNIINTIF